LVAHRLCSSSGGRFERGVTLRHASRAKLLLRLAARTTYGSAGGGAELLLSHRFKVDRQRHQVFDTDPILAALGLPGVDAKWRPDLPGHLLDEGEDALRRAGVWGQPLVGLAPAATWGASKKWSSRRFGALADLLDGHGLQPVILIGPGEESVAAEVQEAAAVAVPVVGPDVDVAGLAGIASHLEALACNDTGPMHLAAMVGTPVVALFGPTDPVRTTPLGDRHVVISCDLDCAPCFEPTCPLKHHDCMRSIDQQQVFEEISQLLV
jgi:ADP-heptose:LPS heptosyltransferase